MVTNSYWMFAKLLLLALKSKCDSKKSPKEWSERIENKRRSGTGIFSVGAEAIDRKNIS